MLEKIITKQVIIQWLSVIYEPDDNIRGEKYRKYEKYKGEVAQLVNSLAIGFYVESVKNFMGKAKEFKTLSQEDKMIFYNMALGVPDKLKEINSFIRQYKDQCSTPIIVDEDVNRLAQIEHVRWFKEMESQGWKVGEMMDKKNKIHPYPKNYSRLNERRGYYKKFIYSIPVLLKEAGYEISRPGKLYELDKSIIEQLAKIIHAVYQRIFSGEKAGAIENEIYSNTSRKQHQFFTSLFVDLPEDIKQSNRDNAFHIPTKLLSIGYKIRPVEKGNRPEILKLDVEEIEKIAKVEHARWCWERRLNGWSYSKNRDNERKLHPNLVPYNQLNEEVKEIDRVLVRLIPALLYDIKYEAYPISYNSIKNISYIINPQSHIVKVLNKVQELNEELKKQKDIADGFRNKLNEMNTILKQDSEAVFDSITRARQIQETFMPSDLDVRQSLHDSFILFKPKDVVSGDFYFVTELNDNVVFAAVDCEGHGIPAALISVFGYNYFDQAVNEKGITDPSKILKYIDIKIDRFLRYKEQGTVKMDGMDLALCVLNYNTLQLQYAGIKNPLYYIRKGELFELEADKYALGLDENGNPSPYRTQTLHLEKNDIIYIFSDGYSDQMGGPRNKKFMRKSFKDLLISIHSSPMIEQGDILNETIEKWKEEGNEEQTDDILVIGVKV